MSPFRWQRLFAPFVFLLERHRASRAEQLRVGKDFTAVVLLDPVDEKVLAALDVFALAKGVDRATLIPAVLRKYVAQKLYEMEFVEHSLRGGTDAEAPQPPPEWLETLPGSWLSTK